MSVGAPVFYLESCMGGGQLNLKKDGSPVSLQSPQVPFCIGLLFGFPTASKKLFGLTKPSHKLAGGFQKWDGVLFHKLFQHISTVWSHMLIYVI